MADATFVEVLNATDKLPVEFCSLSFIKSSISDDKVKKLSSIGMLHDHKELLLCFDDLDTNTQIR